MLTLRTTVWVALVLMAVCPVYSQFSGLGVSGGASLSSFDYGSTQMNSFQPEDGQTKGGGTGGIRFDFDLGTDLFKLSPEFFIVQNGSKEYYHDFSFAQDLLSRQVNLDYVGLYLPLTLYIEMDDGYASDEEYFNGMLIQGRLFADYAINAEVNDKTLGPRPVEFESDFDKLDFGYSFEAGFVFQGFKLMMGYNWGVKNIEFSSSIGGASEENYLVNNKGFTIQVGYLQRFETE